MQSTFLGSRLVGLLASEQKGRGAEKATPVRLGCTYKLTFSNFSLINVIMLPFLLTAAATAPSHNRVDCNHPRHDSTCTQSQKGDFEAGPNARYVGCWENRTLKSLEFDLTWAT